MTENDPQPKPEHEDQIIERRSASEVALVATPIAIAAQPLIAAWANKHIAKTESDPPPPQEQPQAPAEPAE